MRTGYRAGEGKTQPVFLAYFNHSECVASSDLCCCVEYALLIVEHAFKLRWLVFSAIPQVWRQNVSMLMLRRVKDSRISRHSIDQQVAWLKSAGIPLWQLRLYYASSS